MSKILTFFLNALKAIFLSPFYIVYFLIYLLYTILFHFIGEIRILISGFKYGSKKDNKYEKELLRRKQQSQREVR